MSDFELVTVPERRTAVLHETVLMKDLPAFFQRAYGEVVEAMRAEGIAPQGPPFALYLGVPTDRVEVEAGFQVPPRFVDRGAIHASTLPAGKCVHGVHVGPYDTMTETYGELTKWVAEHHLTPEKQMWEVYLSSPQEEPDARGWRTEIFWPVQ